MAHITRSHRWTLDRNDDWVQVPCWCFTEPNGRRSYADLLGDEQADIYERQERERLSALLDNKENN